VTVTPFGAPSWVWRQPGGADPAGEGPEAPFLFVGTLEPRKNLGRLLEAYRLLLDRKAGDAGPVPPLVLAGAPGWGGAGLQRPLHELQARGQLRLEGYCGPDRLWQLYRSARALLFPSLHEGFGFPILEAMAAGLPVLTSARGAMQEVAGDAALLVDPEDPGAIADALQRLQTDARLRLELVTAGWARVRSWTWRRTAEATADVYRRVLATGGARTADLG
jgi:glycosyltransferase involved in cell wall biosynthesis